jgi:hypothetical protein
MPAHPNAMEVQVKKPLLGLLAALALSSQAVLFQAPANAQEVVIAPPPLRVEVVPAPPGPEYVWVHGHWWWNGRAWLWARGHYRLRPHPEAVWVEGIWAPLPSGHYRWMPGHWQR